MATITLKNIPPTLHGVLRQRAVLHHRSLNGEAIACLEAVLLPTHHDAADQFQRIRANRARFTVPLDDALLHQARHEGRP